MKNKLYPILEKFVLNNNVKIKPEDFKLQLISNPSFPSVKSISDTLDYFGIDNVVANVPKDALGQLPECFLAVLDAENGSKSIAQVQRLKNKIKLIKDDGTKENLSIEAFKTLWNGTIVAVEKSTEKVKNNISLFKNPLIPLVILAIIAVVFSIITLETQAIIYTILALVGCCFSYFIVRESLGLHNETTSKICNSAVNNTSCSEVINSKTSKFFQLVSLSDASITFFVSVVLAISLFGYQPSLFLGISIMSIPIALYATYSQAFEIKKWCPLCLGVGGVLIGQVIVTTVFYEPLVFHPIYILKSVAIAIAVYLTWSYIKSILGKSIKQERTQTEFLKFKRNENLFETLLVKDKLPNPEKLDTEFSLSFGNIHAPLVITSVTNPLCGFCTNAFEAYDALLKTHGDKFRLAIIFNVPADSLENPGSQISQKIIDLYKENPGNAYAALKDWFSHRGVDAWQKKYGIPSNETSLQTLELHKTWCDLNEINFTPATTINNHFFPKEYDIKDLSLFIDFLVKKQKSIISSPEPSGDKSHTPSLQ